MVNQTTEAISPPVWAPEQPAWKTLPVDWGMRVAGRLAVGLNALFGRRAGNKVGILTYHRISLRVPGFPAPLHDVEPKRFAEQLSGLLQRGFRFVRLSEVLNAAERGETLPERSLVVTFDDGFASVYTRAWPVLKRLQIPATVFVNTAYLDSDAAFPFDSWGVTYQGRVPAESYRPLLTSECHEMLADGLIEIGRTPTRTPTSVAVRTLSTTTLCNRWRSSASVFIWKTSRSPFRTAGSTPVSRATSWLPWPGPRECGAD